MTPPASFFGFFMAAVLNLPEKPIFETIWVIVVFLGIVALEKIADQQRKQIGGIYAFLKGGLCFFSFFLLSVFFMPNIVEQPLKLAGALIGGTIFAMAVYMPIRFQAEETSIEAREDHPDGQPQDR
jgi:hypothetical protein